MASKSLAVIAGLFSIVVLIKIIVILIKKQLWYKNVAKPIYKNYHISAAVFSILAMIIFYFLMQELNIVQIFSIVAFSSLLIGLNFLLHSKELVPVIEKFYSKKFNPGVWLQILLWLALSFWVIYESYKILF